MGKLMLGRSFKVAEPTAGRVLQSSNKGVYGTGLYQTDEGQLYACGQKTQSQVGDGTTVTRMSDEPCPGLHS